MRGIRSGGAQERWQLGENDAMARRSYGSGSLFVRRDARGRETWYGKWYSGGRRVKRKGGPKRQSGSRDGLTRAQAERELHRRMESERPVLRSRLTIQSSGAGARENRVPNRVPN
jgi:hypothetical protein